MKIITPILFAAATDPAAEAGGSGAGKPVAKADAFLPLDHKDFPKGQPVCIKPKEGAEFTGFLDPVYGWMDERGVVLPATVEPASWKPL